MTDRWIELSRAVQLYRKGVGDEQAETELLLHLIRYHVVPTIHTELVRSTSMLRHDIKEFRHHVDGVELPQVRARIGHSEQINAQQHTQLVEHTAAIAALASGVRSINQTLDECVRPNCDAINALSKIWRLLSHLTFGTAFAGLADVVLGQLKLNPVEALGIIDAAVSGIVHA